jgi:protein-S-isoprenylcysteine O-methyltransferase Ste14
MYHCAHWNSTGDRIYALIFWGMCALWIVPEIVASRVKRAADSSNTRDQGSLKLIALLWVVGIVLDVSLSFFLPQATIRWKRISIFYVGLGLMLAGVSFRWYSASLLGKYFTFDVAIHSGQTIVEKGPYRYIRHPSYTGALLSLLGFGLALGNWGGWLRLSAAWALPMLTGYRSRNVRLLRLLANPTGNI